MSSPSSLFQRVRVYVSELNYVLGESRARLPAMLMLMLATTALDLLGVGLVGPLSSLMLGETVPDIAVLSPNRPRMSFVIVGGGLVLVFAIKAVFGYRLRLILMRFAEGHQALVISRLMDAYLHQSWSYHLKSDTNELLNRVLWYVRSYGGGTLTALLQLVTDGLVFVGLLVLLSTQNPMAVLLLGGVLGIVFITVHKTVRAKLLRAQHEMATSDQRLISAVRHGLGAFREARLLGTEAHFVHDVSEIAGVRAKANAEGSALSTVPRYALEVAVVCSLVLLGGVTFLAGGSAASAAPTLGMFAVAALRLLPASTSLLTNLNNMRATRFALHEVATELRAVDALAAAPITQVSADRPHAPMQLLELRDVTFSYPGAERPALAGAALVVHPGDAIGISGKSGAGKSTLADLILGFLIPSSGSVVVDGVDIHADLPAWWRRVAYIPQTAFLVDETIRRNISFGVPDAQVDEARLQWAIESAQLGQFVPSLPDGLETVVGEAGKRLSGGQRQRVALARALYHDRDLIVLDEATSALDQETEDAVVAAIRTLAGKKTLLVIAHRESTLAACPIRVELENGRIRRLQPAALKAAGQA